MQTGSLRYYSVRRQDERFQFGAQYAELGGRWKSLDPGRGDVGKDNRRPADRVACWMKALLAKVQLLQQLGVLGKIVLLEVIEELATAGSHLQKPAARVEVFAVRAQVLGQVIDASGQERDLDFGRAGILLVGFVFGDDFGFNDCGGHGFMAEFHDCRAPGWAP